MEAKKRYYFDNAATTPIDERVLESMLPYLTDNFGNPSSIHEEGRMAKKAVELSRDKISQIIGAKPSEIIFTSGGTEADNLAILGFARANKHFGRHVITSKIEHKAVIDSCKLLEKEGFNVTYIGVDSRGVVDLKQIEKELRDDTVLVSVMLVNNEIGTIQPIKEIAEIIKKSKASHAVFHTDACQASNYLSINVGDLGVDAMTVSSSKIYGPKGNGCLYVKSGLSLEPILFGGGQEKGQRSGTENIAGIVGFGTALEIAANSMEAETTRLKKLRDYLKSEIVDRITDVTVNGTINERVCNNLNISIRGVEGESLVLMMDYLGFALSTGSACSSSDLNPSHVLMALGIPVELAHCSVRFSLGRFTTKNDVDHLLKSLVESVEKIRKMSAIK